MPPPPMIFQMPVWKKSFTCLCPSISPTCIWPKYIACSSATLLSQMWFHCLFHSLRTSFLFLLKSNWLPELCSCNTGLGVFLIQLVLPCPRHLLPLLPLRFHQPHNRCNQPRRYNRPSPQGGAGEGWWMRTRMRGGGNFWKGTGLPPPAADRRGRSGWCHWKRKQKSSPRQTCSFRCGPIPSPSPCHGWHFLPCSRLLTRGVVPHTSPQRNPRPSHPASLK